MVFLRAGGEVLRDDAGKQPVGALPARRRADRVTLVLGNRFGRAGGGRLVLAARGGAEEPREYRCHLRDSMEEEPSESHLSPFSPDGVRGLAIRREPDSFRCDLID